MGTLKHLVEDCTGVGRMVEEVVEWSRGIEGRKKERKKEIRKEEGKMVPKSSHVQENKMLVKGFV